MNELAHNLLSDDLDVPMDEAEARAVTAKGKAGLNTWITCALRIKRRQGYLAMGYKTLEDWGQHEYGISKRHMYEQLDAEEVRERVRNSAHETPTKLTENAPLSHLLAVKNLEPAQQVQALIAAYESPVSVPVKRKDGTFGERKTVTEKHVKAVVEAITAGNPTPTPESRPVPAPQPRQEARRESLPSGVLSFSNPAFSDDFTLCFQMRQGSSYRVCFIPGELMVPALCAAGVEFGDDELPGQAAGDASDREETLDKFFGDDAAA